MMEEIIDKIVLPEWFVVFGNGHRNLIVAFMIIVCMKIDQVQERKRDKNFNEKLHNDCMWFAGITTYNLLIYFTVFL